MTEKLALLAQASRDAGGPPYLTRTGDAFILPRDPNSGKLWLVWSLIWGMSVDWIEKNFKIFLSELPSDLKDLFDEKKSDPANDKTPRPVLSQPTTTVSSAIRPILLKRVPEFLNFAHRRSELGRCCRKMWFFLSVAVFRLSNAGGCYRSNPICVDFDASWTDPILNDFMHTMRTVGLMAAQGS